MVFYESRTFSHLSSASLYHTKPLFGHTAHFKKENGAAVRQPATEQPLSRLSDGDFILWFKIWFKGYSAHKKPHATSHEVAWGLLSSGANGGSRTHGPLLRRQMLYPSELHPQRYYCTLSTLSLSILNKSAVKLISSS